MRLNDLMKVVLLVVALQLPIGLVIYGSLSADSGVNLVSVAAVILVLLAFSTPIAFALYWLIRRYTSERTIRVALMTLAPDERKVLEIIMQEGKIQQDDLRRKADMSKSKLSALVNNLEKKRTITKTRHHKTNLLEPTPEFKR